ncbi:MAG: hypothetical protein KGL16_12560 [Acidobacteriota bacterium]|nr:hypothetical protein [Acidobacteriota bacterium]
MSTAEHGLSATGPVEAQAATSGDGVPPAGEEIHVPGGSPLPLIVSIGVTLLVIGTTIWWVWSAVGFVVTLVAVVIWVRDVRRDVDELPEEHH